LRTAPSDRDVRTRSTAFRVDLGTRYVTMCGVVCCRKEWGEALYDEAHGARIVGGGGEGNSEQKKKTFSSIFTTDTKSFIHVTRIAALHISFTRIGCTLFTCDMYMCRLRHINDSVLSSLNMEGIRLLFGSWYCIFVLLV
jgi:hypothetical protein